MLHRPLHLPTPFRFHLSPILSLILLSQLIGSLAVEFVLLFISLFELGVQVLPHLADYSSDLGDAQVGMLYFDLVVDVHPVEEEGTERFFGRLGWNVDFHSVAAEGIVGFSWELVVIHI